MIVGDLSVFAIESGVSRFSEHRSMLALGFFVLWVGGRRYGVHEPDATMLGCSRDEVGARIAHRGLHTAPFAAADAGAIAAAYRNVAYTGKPAGDLWGMSEEVFDWTFSVERGVSLVWAPDGDEAFDDGSYVLQFDVENRVRIIAFRSDRDPVYDEASLRDVWLDADTFYATLSQWKAQFETELAALAPNRSGG